MVGSLGGLGGDIIRAISGLLKMLIAQVYVFIEQA
jgi:hypothetical protein